MTLRLAEIFIYTSVYIACFLKSSLIFENIFSKSFENYYIYSELHGTVQTSHEYSQNALPDV